jgi:hypothetical protein
VDVVVEMRRPDLFYLVHIKTLLEGALQRPVEVVRYCGQMNAFLKRRIDEEAIDGRPGRCPIVCQLFTQRECR